MIRNVLVTGGAGYIGSHVCKALQGAGINPISFDNYSRGHREFVQWGPGEEGDIQDTDLVEAILKKHKVNAVIHMAGFAYVGESIKNPLTYFDNNVSGSVSLLKAICRAGIKHMVFSSSCATYGVPDELPIDEDSRQKPINPYGYSKLMVEDILKDLSETGLMSSVSLRYFNAGGADPKLEIGEKHDPETHLVPLVIQATEINGNPIRVFGDDYPTKDGTCIRDFIHVTDLADAHVRALQYIENNKGAHFFNLGTGVGSSVLDVIKTAEKITGKPVRRTIDPRRPGDPPVLVADYVKAKKELGWVLNHSNLYEIVETAYRWEEKNK